MGLVKDETESGHIFLGAFPNIKLIPPFLHNHLIHFVSFHFIRPGYVASGVVNRYLGSLVLCVATLHFYFVNVAVLLAALSQFKDAKQLGPEGSATLVGPAIT